MSGSTSLKPAQAEIGLSSSSFVTRRAKSSADCGAPTAYGWLFTQLLVVPEQTRGQGLGRRLMSLAEAEAVKRGCHAAWLDTFEFQAKAFYEKIGYSCFATLPDFPKGSSRYFMRKDLRPVSET